jgi:integrase/recombinase XerD
MYLDAGGDLFSLSHEMGHKNIQTPERYLRSFKSKNARMHHNDHSPINHIKLRSHRKPKGQNKKSSRE